jgi:hypothetical protein
MPNRQGTVQDREANEQPERIDLPSRCIALESVRQTTSLSLGKTVPIVGSDTMASCALQATLNIARNNKLKAGCHVDRLIDDLEAKAGRAGFERPQPPEN